MKTDSVSNERPGSKLFGGANQVRLGRLLVQRLYICLKNVRIYDAENVAVREASEQLAGVLRTIHAQERRVVLVLPYDFLVLNDHRLRPAVTGYAAFEHVVGELKRRQVGALYFERPLSAEEVVRFCSAFLATSVDVPAPFDDLSDRLKDAGLSAIGIEPYVELPSQMTGAQVSREIKQRSVDAFFRSIQVSKQILETSDPRRLNFRHAKRAIQKMVDTITQEETALLSLATIKNFDQYTFNHSANVAVYSIAIGQRAGLSRPALSELGMAGLFHDLGKTHIPKEILNKPSMLAEHEWTVMQEHSVRGAEILLKTRRLNDTLIRNILVAFEHHLNVDLGGYPTIQDPRDLNLYSKIVAIADCFDALTTPRIYRKHNYTAQEALALMMEGRGSVYDPTLLKIFVNCLGVYPVGSLVKLDSGEMGVVCRPHGASNSSTPLPVLRVFADQDGNPVPHRMEDLAAEDCAVQILQTMDPGDYFESIEDYIAIL